MNNTFKTGLAALFTLIISLSFVYFFLVTNEYLYALKESEERFNFSDFDDSKKTIIIIGSSQVRPINMTFVNDEVSKVCSDCEVYNLAKRADTPKKRVIKLNLIKNFEPELVFYVISYRDFANIKGEEIVQVNTPKSILPDPQEFFQKEILYKTLNTDFNPKLLSLKFLKGKLVNEESYTSKVLNPDLLLLYEGIVGDHLAAFSSAELAEKNPKPKTLQRLKIDPLVHYKNVNALKTIITELKKNEIEVVIVSAPLPQFTLDLVSKSDKKLFTDTLNDISQEFNVPLYRLDEKFSGMDIWYNYLHISESKKGLPYSKEVVEIIKNELE